MATSDQRNKWKCEELATALSGSKKLSALEFVINPKKRTRQRLSQASKHDPASISHSSQQVNPVNPPTSDVGIITVSNSRNEVHKLTNPTSTEVPRGHFQFKTT